MDKPRRHKGRCRACGKLIKPGEKAIRVARGHLHGIEDDIADFDEHVDDGTWGHLHERCFLFAIGDPSAIMAA